MWNKFCFKFVSAWNKLVFSLKQTCFTLKQILFNVFLQFSKVNYIFTILIFFLGSFQNFPKFYQTACQLHFVVWGTYKPNYTKELKKLHKLVQCDVIWAVFAVCQFFWMFLFLTLNMNFYTVIISPHNNNLG